LLRRHAVAFGAVPAPGSAAYAAADQVTNWGGHFIVTYANKVDATPDGPGI
jgi:hypothetical protein